VKTMMPAFGLGHGARPFVTGGVGYSPVGSVLLPVDAIVSLEPVAGVIGQEPQNATSYEPEDIVGLLEETSLVSEEVLDLVSSESFGKATYGEAIGLTIIEFGGTAGAWGSASSIGKVAQTGYNIGEMMVTSVAVKMNNPNGATDDVTLSLHRFAHFGIPEELPAPDELEVLASATVSGVDIPTGWTYVVFKFDEPVELPYDWSFVLTRGEPSDTVTYGFWLNGFANFNTGYVTVTIGYDGGWTSGSTADMSMVINKKAFRSGLIESFEFDDLTSEQPDDILSTEPDDLESEEPI
jgi:hypothetical protein